MPDINQGHFTVFCEIFWRIRCEAALYPRSRLSPRFVQIWRYLRLGTETPSSPHARLSLNRKVSRTCSTAAFIAASAIRVLRSPTAALLCRGSDPPPACAPACSHGAVVRPAAPRSHPFRRTSLFRRTACVRSAASCFPPSNSSKHIQLCAVPSKQVILKNAIRLVM